MTNDFVIEIFEHDIRRPKRGRWVMRRHPQGSRDVCKFPSVGVAKYFAKRHSLNFIGKVRVRDFTTNETWALS